MRVVFTGGTPVPLCKLNQYPISDWLRELVQSAARFCTFSLVAMYRMHVEGPALAATSVLTIPATAKRRSALFREYTD